GAAKITLCGIRRRHAEEVRQGQLMVGARRTFQHLERLLICFQRLPVVTHRPVDITDRENYLAALRMPAASRLLPYKLSATEEFQRAFVLLFFVGDDTEVLEGVDQAGILCSINIFERMQRSPGQSLGPVVVMQVEVDIAEVVYDDNDSKVGRLERLLG